MENSITAAKKVFLLCILFGLIAIAALSPIASNEIIPNSSDFANHIVGIAQAKLAMESGQFPIRTMPELYEGWGYPYFQFYSPSLYFVAGSIYKWITPQNPFIAFKLTMWLSLIVAGIYIFRLAKEFVASRGAALLAAVLYITSPYLLVDIGVRGSLTETVAACVLPLVLFYSIRCQRKPTLKIFAFTAIVWFVLATVHIVTFVFSSFFVGIFLVCLNINERTPLRNLFIVGLAYGLGWLLALWHLAPAILLQPSLYTHHILTNPYYFNWLSPLATLLSVSAVSPIPYGIDKLLYPFYVGIGWPVLLAVGFVFYKFFFSSSEKKPPFLMPALCLFLIVFMLTWSPFNFWVYLPVPLKVVQFGFRFLIQIMWLGALLFAWSVAELFNYKLDIRHILVGIFLIWIAHSSWLLSAERNTKTVKDLVAHPALYEWGSRSYVISPLLTDHKEYSELYLTAQQTKNRCHQEKKIISCVINIPEKKSLVQLPALFYPSMLDVKVDGQHYSYEAVPRDKKNQTVLNVNPMLVGLELPKGKHNIAIEFVGFHWANLISLGAGVFIVLLFLFGVSRTVIIKRQ